jgi:hypothetical protein
MGLDVYLYHYKGMTPFKNFEEAYASHKEICEKDNEAKRGLYPEYDKYQQLSEKERDELRKKAHNITKKVVKGTPWEHSLDNCGDIEFSAEEQIEKDSKTDPSNMFKIGYFRSSYNDGGINSVLRNNDLMDLYGIFGVERSEHDYYIRPDWKKALKNVRKVMKAFEPISKDGISCSHYGSLTEIKDEKEALKAFRAEIEKGKSSFGSYSNAVGTFFMDKPIEVLAIMSGRNCIGSPGAYIIYKTKSEDGLKWYMTALKIVEETIEYVLAQEDPENYYFHWSA